MDKGIDNITDDTGESLKKAYVTSKIETLGEGVKDLKGGFTVYKNFLESDDPGGFKLLMKQKDFNALVKKFYSYPGAPEAKAAMDAYVAAVQYCNGKLDDYNAAFAQYQDLRGERDKVTLEIDTTQGVLASTAKPDLPAMTAYITALYDRVKSTCIEQLYQASRAYTFWSLKNYNAFYDVLNLGEPDKIDASVISTGKATIIDKKLATIDKRSVDLLQDYPAEKNQIVGGIRIVLTPTTYSAVFDSLKKLVSVVTGVDKNGKIQIAKQYLAVIDLRLLPKKTWGDFRNIRVKRARVWMYGMQTTNNVHHIDFTIWGMRTLCHPTGPRRSPLPTKVRMQISYMMHRRGLRKSRQFTQERARKSHFTTPKVYAKILPRLARWRSGCLPLTRPTIRA
jgi:hypothetical protein